MLWRRTLLLGFIAIVWGGSLATALVISARVSAGDLYQRQLDDEVANRTVDGVHLAAEYGLQLIAAARTNLTGSIERLDALVGRMADNIDCDAATVLRQAKDECTYCCGTMKELISATVSGVLELPPSSLKVYIGNRNLPIASKNISYKYESTDKKDDQLNCPLTKIIKVEKIQILGKKVHKSESTQGYSIDESCASLRIFETSIILDTIDDVSSSQARYDNALVENADAVFGSGITVEDLLGEGAFECDRSVSSCGDVKADVYLKCHAKAISKELGSFSSESCTADETAEVDLIERTESDLDTLLKEVAEQLVREMTETMALILAAKRDLEGVV